jgi:hypothetical protein
MQATLKWTGFAMVAFGITVFPFAIWVPGPWGVIALLLVMFGCVVLLAAMVLGKRAAPPDSGPEDG